MADFHSAESVVLLVVAFWFIIWLACMALSPLYRAAKEASYTPEGRQALQVANVVGLSALRRR